MSLHQFNGIQHMEAICNER